MYELVEVWKDDIFTNSKVVAEGTNNQHESVVAIIRKYENDILDFGELEFSDLKSGKRGQPESIIKQTIEIDMSMGMHYKDIYKDCKEQLAQFAEITYLIA